ncbi:MFS transporter [Ornithinimicrobium sp. Arc0846-15]|nr:MFS transporter [Ornithinimicrobium laminariae]
MPALIGMTIAGFAGYASLITVAPLWVVEGGASEAGAGLVNGVLLGFTVLTQLFVPGLVRRADWGMTMSAGMVLMGVPSLLHLFSDGLEFTLVLSALRGVGFGILTVTGSAAVAELVDPARRGAAIGAYGLAVAMPNLVILPLSPFVATTVGFWPVFLIGAGPLIGIPFAIRLSRVLHGPMSSDPDAAVTHSSSAAATMTLTTAYRRLLRPMALLLGVTLSGGAIITFAPQLVDKPWAATLALFGMGLTGALSRWRMGALADKYGADRFLPPLVVLTVLSMALTAWAISADEASTFTLIAFVLASALLGVSYGGLQNLTLVVAFEVVPRKHIGTASAMWNLGFDLGTASGSVLVGLLAAGWGFPQALLVCAGLAGATLPLAWRRYSVRAQGGTR